MIRFPLAAALAVAMALCAGAVAEDKVPLPASPPLMEVLASIDRSGRLAFRMNLPEYRPRVQPASEGGKEKQATTYEVVHRELTYQFDPKEIRAYDSRGKEIDAKDLPALLKRETLALYAACEKLDPLQLRSVKDGTLIFLYTSKAPGLGQGPARAAATPVPGLAELLKKQGYLAVPVQPHADDRLSVRVTVRGKELRLLVDTGAGHTCFDRHRVRHLGLEWHDDDFCDIEDLEIGGLKTGPLHVDTFDLTGINRSLRAMNQPEQDGVLGGGVLRPLGAVIDHAGGVLYLRPREGSK